LIYNGIQVSQQSQQGFRGGKTMRANKADAPAEEAGNPEIWPDEAPMEIPQQEIPLEVPPDGPPEMPETPEIPQPLQSPPEIP
jgi:hypothetical protein